MRHGGKKKTKGPGKGALLNWGIDLNKLCGEGVKFDRIRRITGYLSATKNWNNAKTNELKDRVMHEVKK